MASEEHSELDPLEGTSFVKKVFMWESDSTVWRRVKSGFLPAPVVEGRRKKWPRSVILAKRDALLAEVANQGDAGAS